MRGEGNIAQMVAQQYKKYGKLYGMNAEEWSLNTSILEGREQGRLFKMIPKAKLILIKKLSGEIFRTKFFLVI